ncbi:MAG: arylsulfatase, partial [Planctomycetes bacterium]|nr:arylsulfatase [Planctomycetota bacterium]
MIEGRWKLIVPSDSRRASELYDLLADPDEGQDVLQRESARAREMRAKLDAWWDGKP